MRYLVSLVLITLVALSSVSVHAAPLQMQFAIITDARTPSAEAAQKIADLLQSKFKGKLTVSLRPNGEMGSELQVMKRMQNGEPVVNFLGTALLSNMEPSFMLFDLPYAFKSYDHVNKVLNGPIGQEMTKRLLKKGFRILGWMDIGFCTIGTTQAKIQSFGDFNGLSIRTAESPVLIDTLRSMGMKPLALSMKDARKAMESRNLDALWTVSLANMYDSKFYQFLKYIYWGKLDYVPRAIVISESTWESLPADVQAAFQQAIKQVIPWQLAKARSEEAVYKQKIEKAGVKIVQFPDEVESREREKLDSIWNRYTPLIGEDLVRQLRNSY